MGVTNNIPPDLIHSAQLADSQPSIPLATSAPCVPACSSKVDDHTSNLDDPSDFDESSDRGGSSVLDHDDSPKLGISQAAIPLLKPAPHVFIKPSEFVGSQTAIALATTAPKTPVNIHALPNELIAHVLKLLSHDVRSTACAAQVCKLWQSSGGHLIWHTNQLRDLLDHGLAGDRLARFAALVENIYHQPGDQVLANPRVRTLNFNNLKSVEMYSSNIRTTPMEVDIEGIKALITSSLKSWIMTHDYGARFYLSHNYSGLISLPGPFPDINNNLLKEFLASGVNLEVLNLGEDLGAELGLKELIQIMRMPKLKSFCSSRVLGFTPEIVDMVVQRLGSHHFMPHLRKLDYLWCHSGYVSAASRLLPMMPGLEKLRLDLDDHFSSTWNNAIDFVIFPILATLKNLQELRMLCKAEWQLDGKHLLELTCLDDLEVLIIHMRPGVPCSFTMEGAQFASLLRGLPKLRSLRLGVGSCFVSASREDFDYINEAVSRIEDVDLESITLVHDESLDTESGSQ
ncbi:hypothetical protein E4T38_01821 [Aureobasidium subglaciale]|nr:hypothetical protein E4T38_01821 [Aureobasidium subglaciale]KAI5229259.1 hypothetical protein E4T40_01659 [Aureobasidium subglaciale]KAI5232910.1 hypothetical protein E4T41_01819 [Aureobasidium subglaciale]KAI5266290.1 hypothetical protein E4T46_01656 [Aureobasidium subglaciale]